MTEDEKRAEVKMRIASYVEKQTLINERASKLVIADPYTILVERIDKKKIMTFLSLDTASDKDRIRMSSVCRVIKISDLKADDELLNAKRSFLKVGDYAHFNSESAFHLGVDNFFEIWAIHVNNIIVVDNLFDAVKIYEESLLRGFGLD